MYSSTKLNIFEDLCIDVTLKLDFQCQHQRLIFEFNGKSPDLIMSGDSHCSVAATHTKEVLLLSNLSMDIKAIATKSRRFNRNVRDFIHKNVNALFDEEIIRPSTSFRRD